MMRLLLLGLLMAPSAALAGWVQMYQEAGVTVYSKTIPGSKFVAFKGTADLPGPIDKVLYVLMDQEHRIEWVDRLYKNEILQQNSDYDYVLYQAFDLPPIMSDRDYVYHGTVQNDGNGGVILEMKSVEHPDAPPTVGVRANLVNSRYLLVPTEAGGTWIEVEIQTDPQGMLPAWLVNLIQKSWPVKTLNGIKTQLGKSYTASYPLPPGPEQVAEPEVEEAVEEPVEEAPIEAETAEEVGEEDTAE